ncbi:MAG: hypothetical protein O2960_30625, partial [Verrucomicrobia bacterium]|nr:hypothetical protein [Verrucomicrobiota bacterium]
QSGSGVPPLNSEDQKRRDAASTLGHDSPNMSSPEGAKGKNELPKGWKWSPLGKLSNVVRGGSPRPAGDPRYFGGDIPWITVGSITADTTPYLRAVPQTVTAAGKERSRFVERGTLLLTNSGAKQDSRSASPAGRADADRGGSGAAVERGGGVGVGGDRQPATGNAFAAINLAESVYRRVGMMPQFLILHSSLCLGSPSILQKVFTGDLV